MTLSSKQLYSVDYFQNCALMHEKMKASDGSISQNNCTQVEFLCEQRTQCIQQGINNDFLSQEMAEKQEVVACTIMCKCVYYKQQGQSVNCSCLVEEYDGSMIWSASVVLLVPLLAHSQSCGTVQCGELPVWDF